MYPPDKEVQYDEMRAYSIQRSPMLIGNYTVSYRINKRRVSHEFSVKGLNFTGSKEFIQHLYNIKTGKQSQVCSEKDLEGCIVIGMIDQAVYVYNQETMEVFEVAIGSKKKKKIYNYNGEIEITILEGYVKFRERKIHNDDNIEDKQEIIKIW